jgi:hypothetical protein
MSEEPPFSENSKNKYYNFYNKDLYRLTLEKGELTAN